jgi:hypothetical protein
LDEQQRAGLQVEDHKGAEHDGGNHVSGNTQGEQGNQGGAIDGVVAGLGGGDTFQGAIAELLSNKIGQGAHFDGLARAHEYTGITIPAVILVMHVRITLMIKPQNIHRAHVHTDTALIAAGIIQFET